MTIITKLTHYMWRTDFGFLTHFSTYCLLLLHIYYILTVANSSYYILIIACYWPYCMKICISLFAFLYITWSTYSSHVFTNPEFSVCNWFFETKIVFSIQITVILAFHNLLRFLDENPFRTDQSKQQILQKKNPVS